jgi:hypothetical protein
LLLVFAFTAPVAAQTMTNGSAVTEQHREACNSMLTATHDMMEALNADPAGDVAGAMKKVDDGVKNCDYPHYVSAAQAFETYAKAVVAHRAGDASWAPTLDSAITQLAACQSFFSSGKLGTHCATVATIASKEKLDWSAGPAATASP